MSHTEAPGRGQGATSAGPNRKSRSRRRKRKPGDGTSGRGEGGSQQRGRSRNRNQNRSSTGRGSSQDRRQDGRQGGRQNGQQDSRPDDRKDRGRRRRPKRRRRPQGQGAPSGAGSGGGGRAAASGRGPSTPPSAPDRDVEGVIEILKDGTGFLRRVEHDYSIRETDVFVPTGLVRKHHLEEGFRIVGRAGPPQNRRPGPVLMEIESIEGFPVDAPELLNRKHFRDLTSLDPTEKFRLSEGTTDPSVRLLDLLTPIGKGQRGLIVAPPRTGKTMLMQRVAHSITENHPEVHLIVVLVDERPEEATEWKRSVKRGEVLSSTSDEMAANHVNIAEIAIERAKRLVELGRDVVILMDSLTRLARAYNLETKNSGRTLTGGVDARTLSKPKAFFGAARNAEEGGSLTILATALIETGSRMDQVIFEEFKGTGNMELVLSRKLADLRIFPAFDIHLSGTRKEEKLIPQHLLSSVWALRRVLQTVDPVEGMRILIKKIGETATNEQFLGSFKQD